MENNQFPSKKKSFTHEGTLNREVDESVQSGRTPKKPLLLEILQKGSTLRNSSQKVLVSIKPRAPAIKTLYIAEKSRFQSKKQSQKFGSRLAIGDHSSFTSHYSEEDCRILGNVPCSQEFKRNISTHNIQESSIAISTCVTSSTSRDVKVYSKRNRSSEKCYMYTYPHMTINTPKLQTVTENSKTNPNKADIGTLIVTNTSSDCTISPSIGDIKNINKRLDYLEKKVLKQEMVFRTLDLNVPLSSSEDDTKNENVKSHTGQPGCSYVEYSHIPETSAFQRYAQQPAPLSPSKATTIQKEHNSEQYGRDFTLYDGITARGRRQCASVPCKRDDIPKIAAERVHRIRHKLNPVRDYRLMDTVHYLAQGEFAPRDDGIKLTPSREAVLSDIIWEDVCRTHWPNTRLGRRIAHPERYGTRSELQRLIDSLLRERVQHVERRRRRHYRIVKLNNRHENCRPAVGKTGDIIVASHKNRRENDDRDEGVSDHETARAVMTERRLDEHKSRRDHKSQDRLMYDTRTQRSYTHDECTPGPSYAARSSIKQPTCCYRSSSPNNRKVTNKNQGHYVRDQTSGSSIIMSKVRPKHPRLVVKKSSGRRKYPSKEPNLEHFILLPTLVIRTPSNMKRQKRFNELYHKILNGHARNDQVDVKSEDARSELSSATNKKDIGLNINITLSESEENLQKKL